MPDRSPVIGIGVDMVDLDRFRTALARTPTLRRRIFRPDEQAYADLRSDPTERYAVRFAAKEAVMKALGVGLGEVAMYDIEVVREGNGRPTVCLHGRAAEVADEKGITEWLITLTHAGSTAQAFVVAR